SSLSSSATKASSPTPASCSTSPPSLLQENFSPVRGSNVVRSVRFSSRSLTSPNFPCTELYPLSPVKPHSTAPVCASDPTQVSSNSPQAWTTTPSPNGSNVAASSSWDGFPVASVG